MASSLKLSVNGRKYLVSGITKGTSCKDLLCALAKVASKEPDVSDVSLMKSYTCITASRLMINESTKGHKSRSYGDIRPRTCKKDKNEISPKNEKCEISKKDKYCEGLKKEKSETSNKKQKKSKSKDYKENKENKSKKTKIKGQKDKDRKCTVDDSDIERYNYRKFNKRVKRKAYDDSDVETYQSLLSLVDCQSKQIKTQVKDMKICKTEWVEAIRKKTPSFSFIDAHENRLKAKGPIIADSKGENDADSGLPSLDYDSSREPSIKEDDISGRHDSGIGSETNHASPVIGKRSEQLTSDKGSTISFKNSNNTILVKNNGKNKIRSTESLKDKDCRTNGCLISTKERNSVEIIDEIHSESVNIDNAIVTPLVHGFQGDETRGNDTEFHQLNYNVNKIVNNTAGADVASVHDKPTLNCNCLEERTEDIHKTASNSIANINNNNNTDSLNKIPKDDLISAKERNCFETTDEILPQSINIENGIVTALVHTCNGDEIEGNYVELRQFNYNVHKIANNTVSLVHDKPTLNCSCLEERVDGNHTTETNSIESINNNNTDNLNKTTEDDPVDMLAERRKLWTEYSQTRTHLTDITNELLYKDLILLQLEFEFKCLNEENSDFEDQVLADETTWCLEELLGTQDLLKTVNLLTRYQDHDAQNNIRELQFLEHEVGGKRMQAENLEKLVWRARYKTAPRSLIKRCRNNPILKHLISDDFDDDIVETTFV